MAKRNSEKNSVDAKKKDRPQNKNLKPMKPGETRNPNGRPKGKRNRDTLIDMALLTIEEDLARKYNATHKRKTKTSDDYDVELNIFMQLIVKAYGGDMKAIDSFLDRRHGKATQPLELNGGDKPILTEEVINARKEKLLKWQSQWLNLKPKQNAGDTSTKRKSG